MSFLARLFGLDQEGTAKTFNRLYHKARRARPMRTERECLKIVLLTKPPFDYQFDELVEKTLDEHPDIDTLASHAWSCRPNGPHASLWKNREINKKVAGDYLKHRNHSYFRYFWADQGVARGDPPT